MELDYLIKQAEELLDDMDSMVHILRRCHDHRFPNESLATDAEDQSYRLYDVGQELEELMNEWISLTQEDVSGTSPEETQLTGSPTLYEEEDLQRQSLGASYSGQG